MNIISCGKCGVLLDIDRIPEPNIDDDGRIDTDKALWINRDYVPAMICPVCHTKIAYRTGDTD